MSQGKVDRQQGYVLHTQPYRETSLLVEVLTRAHGRFTLMARGARRPKAEVRGVLLPFQPLTLAWFGKGELRTLHTVHWNGGVPQLSGLPLVCGFYLNELVMRLTARDDPMPEAFDVYDAAIRGLGRQQPLSAVLRRFEVQVVRELGYAPPLGHDAEGQPVLAELDYLCRSGELPERDTGQSLNGSVVSISGASLLAIEADDFSLVKTRLEARALMRTWFAGLLGEDPLASRELLQAINALSE